MNVVYSAPAEYDLKGIPTHAPGDITNQVLFRSTSFVNPYWWLIIMNTCSTQTVFLAMHILNISQIKLGRWIYFEVP